MPDPKDPKNSEGPFNPKKLGRFGGDGAGLTPVDPADFKKPASNSTGEMQPGSGMQHEYYNRAGIKRAPRVDRSSIAEIEKWAQGVQDAIALQSAPVQDPASRMRHAGLVAQRNFLSECAGGEAKLVQVNTQGLMRSIKRARLFQDDARVEAMQQVGKELEKVLETFEENRAMVDTSDNSYAKSLRDMFEMKEALLEVKQSRDFKG